MGDQACEVCSYATEHDRWPDSLRSHTHCRGCHMTFPASQKWGHCSRCHHTFAGTSAFDAHQRVDKETGELLGDCLCAVLEGMDMADLPDRVQFDVSGSVVLEYYEKPFGYVWGVLSDNSYWTGENNDEA